MPAKLILFPVPIGNENPDASLPPYNRELLNTCTTFIVEDQRTARRNLKRMGYTAASLDEVELLELNEHTPATDLVGYLDPIVKHNRNIGLMSEAGLPCVADPGTLITAEAQRRGIEVVPLVGPSSIMLALMASGFNGQNFAFNGYAPIKLRERDALLKRIEVSIHRDNQTQIFIEAPYRNNQFLEYLAHQLLPLTRICVAADLTLPTQYIRARLSRQWLDNPPDLNKRPAIFLLYK